MIRHLDLFSGIGGFALAVRWLGHETVGFCELDPWCRRVLDKHWPGVPKHDDIRTLTGSALEQFGRIDLITGGYPCQPFSVAGLRRGKEDDRYLWPSMFAVIAATRPTYVLAENSPNIRTMVLDDMYDDLEGIGYAVRACVVPAASVGALHQRDRMWTLAHLDGARQSQPSGLQPGQWLGIGSIAKVPADPDRSGCRPGKRDLQAGESSASDDSPGVVADPDRERREKQRRSFATDETLQHSAECDRWWPAEPPFLRRVHGIPHRVDRVRGLGNAIVPQIAFEILRVMFGESA